MNTKNTGAKLWQEAKRIIPGGSQLTSKRSEYFLPEHWPSYYSKAKGVEIWDLDGRKYIDMMYMGVGACLLGYADPDVNRAVKKVVDQGSMASLNPPEEIELAKLLIKLHPWARMVRYARTGGEAMAVAMRIARAYSGKDKIAFSGYHGWHDWYISANLANDKNLDGHLIPGLEPKGIPRSLTGVTLPFYYNKIEELEKLVAENKDIGVIVIEPSRHVLPASGFLERAREIATEIGAVLVIDEIQVGWVSNIGGVHLTYGITPDIAVFSKAMANGYPMAAIIGKERVMQSAQETYMGSTFWSERIGPVAALTTIRKLKAKNVPAHLKKIGVMIQKGWEKSAIRSGLDIKIGLGTIAKPEFSFNHGEQSLAIRTLFTQEMLKRGFLDVACVYVSYAHKEFHIKKYLKAIDEVFAFLAKVIKEDRVMQSLDGPVAHNRFKRIS